MTTWYWIMTGYCVVMWALCPMIALKGIKDLDKDLDKG
jgi:hypothetical protein